MPDKQGYVAVTDALGDLTHRQHEAAVCSLPYSGDTLIFREKITKGLIFGLILIFAAIVLTNL